jgi:iron complex outermembrane recepter protein
MLHLLAKRLLAFFIVLSPAFAFTQNCHLELKGLVEDDAGEVLVGASVWIEALKSGTATSIDGTFSFPNLCPGQYVVLVKFVGYEDQIFSVRLPVAKLPVVKLKSSVNVLHDLVVEGSHAAKHSFTQSLSIVTQEELMASKGKTLGEMLQQVPGVTNLMSGPSVFKPVINGLHSQRVLILNNGIRQEGQQWGIDHAPEIDTYVASELEVIKGAEGVRYGTDAMGGVIIINTQPLHYSSGVGGEAHLGMASNNRMGVFSGMLEGGFPKSSGIAWRVQGTLKKGGDYHAPDYNLSNTGAGEKNFSLTFGYKKKQNEAELYFSSFNTKIAILRSSHTGNLNDLQNSIINNRPWYIEDFTYEINNPKQQVGHQLLKVKYKRKLSAGTLNVLYGGQFNQRKEFDIRRDKQDIPGLSLELYSHAIDGSFDYGKGKWLGSFGINGTGKQNTNLTGVGLLPNFTQYSAGVFIIEKYKQEKFLFEFGGRVDHQLLEARMIDNGSLLKPEFKFLYPAFSLGSSIFLNRNARFLTNLGVTSRPPQMSELYSQGLHHGTASIEEGLLVSKDGMSTNKADIKMEQSYKWINTFQYHRTNFNAEITGYINYFNNYVYLTPYETRLTIRGFFPVFHYQQTNALLTGADLSAEVNVSKNLLYTFKASYVCATNRSDPNERLPFIPPADISNSLTYKFPSSGSLKNLNASLYSTVFFKQTRAPQTIYPENIPSSGTESIFDFMDAPDGYVLFKADVSATLPLGNRELNLSISGENLLNSSYRNYMNRLRYFADETGFNFLLRINYKFHSHN